MYHGYIDVPTFAYFNFGNIWTGSLLTDYNYRILPLKKEDPPVLMAEIWHGRKNRMLVAEEDVEFFTQEFSAEGYEKLLAELNKRISEYKQAIGY